MGFEFLAHAAFAVATALPVLTLLLWLRARRTLALYRRRYGPAMDIDEHVARQSAELHRLEVLLGVAREAAELAEFGYGAPQRLYRDSAECHARLQRCRTQQKEMLKSDRAAICYATWTVQGSKAKGRTMTERYLRLQLRAFNGESDAIIGKVTFRNLAASLNKIRVAFDRINALGKTNCCRVVDAYRDLKVEELSLAHDYATLKQDEKAEQQRIAAAMREEQRAAQELEVARRETEADEARQLAALDRARRELEATHGAAREGLLGRISDLESALQEAHARAERAKSMAEQTRRGHVYVVSNVGSFGDGVFKIGMTRRLDPRDRVDELGDASVPFPFDVHAMIHSEDAPTLEAELHRRFDQHRMNLVNRRKEFFRVPIDDVARAVQECGADITFTRLAEAEEFERTLRMRDPAITAEDALHELSLV